MPEWPELSGTENCEECENFMKYVKGYFSDEETHREAEVAVEKWCNDLPSEYSAECVQMVQEYLPVSWFSMHVLLKLNKKKLIINKTLTTIVGCCAHQKKLIINKTLTTIVGCCADHFNKKN